MRDAAVGAKKLAAEVACLIDECDLALGELGELPAVALEMIELLRCPFVVLFRRQAQRGRFLRPRSRGSA